MQLSSSDELKSSWKGKFLSLKAPFDHFITKKLESLTERILD